MLVILYSMPILCSVYEAPYINFQGYNDKKNYLISIQHNIWLNTK